MEEIEQERHRELLSITICCTIELYKKKEIKKTGHFYYCFYYLKAALRQ